jgi:signal transduction histidine kinase/CheY-like chemotaxis protein
MLKQGSSMWYQPHDLTTHNAFLHDASELRQSAARMVLVATGGFILAMCLLVALGWPKQAGWAVWGIVLVFLPCGLVSLRLLERHFGIAQWLWFIGLLAAITLAVVLFQQPALAVFYLVVPLMGVVLLGRAGAVGIWLVLLGLLWGLTNLPWPSLSPILAIALGISSLLIGIVGWVSSSTIITIARWSIYYADEAQRHLREAQEQRAQLAILLKDLDHAYYRLERANSGLVVARKLAEEAERFKAEFVATISHELRTPLNLIVGFSEVMLLAPESYDGVALPGPYRTDLSSIHRNARYLLALADDILDTSRLEAGKIALVREPVHLAALITDAADTMRDYIAAKQLQLLVSIAPDLPKVFIDRLRIRQVLLNLLVNAARFTEKGTITVTVECQAQAVRVRVSDTGCGIAPADLATIFKTFHTSSQQSTRWHSGTGLGLPLSKQFVELHQGTMGVESSLGAGTTCWFTLPIAEQTASAMARQIAWKPVVPLTTTERMVVVVHEDQRSAALVERALAGYRTIWAADLAQGLHLADELRAIALLLDLAQPLPAGEQAVPIIHTQLPSYARFARSLHAVDVLLKPVGQLDLAAVLQHFSPAPRRILIVDDEPDLVRLYQRLVVALLPAGQCWEAFNGDEALQLMQTLPFDLILLDINMPERDGKSVLDAIANDSALATLPVVILSGDEQLMQLPFVGAWHFIPSIAARSGEGVQQIATLLELLGRGWAELHSREPGSPARLPA